MGMPMARNLSRNFPTIVWNRTTSKYAELRDVEATIGQTPSEVARQSSIVFTMLFDEHAMRSVLSNSFMESLRGKTLVNTSSVSVEFSHYISKRVQESGGDYIEMPVSGSKVPAEQGQLVGMMAGDRAISEKIKRFLEPITREAIYCGPIGSGLQTKYAINLYLVSITAGLAESMNLARAQGLDLEAFGKVLDASPLASPYSKVKIAKLLRQDWSAQASVRDCYNSTKLIQSAAETSNAKSPLAKLCLALYKQANEAGLGNEDMISIIKLLSHAGSEVPGPCDLGSQVHSQVPDGRLE